MPEIPRVELPHPIAGSGAENMLRVSEAIAERLGDVLSGAIKGEVLWGDGTIEVQVKR